MAQRQAKKQKSTHRQSLARARIIQPEVNNLDIYIPQHTLSASPTQLIYHTWTGGTVLDHITHINRGDADNQRVGGKLKALTLQMRLEFFTKMTAGDNGHAMTAVATPGSIVAGFRKRQVDLWIVQNKNPRGVGPTAGSIWDLDATGIIEELLLRKHDQTSEYRILAHKQTSIDMINQRISSTTIYSPTEWRTCELFLQLPDDMVVTYKDASSGAIANCVENSLHCFAVVDNGGAGSVNSPTLPIDVVGYMRLRFLDL